MTKSPRLIRMLRQCSLLRVEVPYWDTETIMLSMAAKTSGLPEIFIPRAIVRVAALPVLGTGKTDYVEAARLATQATAATEEATA